MAVLLAIHDMDAAVLAGVALQQGAHARVGRRIVGNAQFPVRINLCAYRRDGLLQEGQRRIKDRQDDRDQRLQREIRQTGAQARAVHLVERAITAHPFGIVVAFELRGGGNFTDTEPQAGQPLAPIQAIGLAQHPAHAAATLQGQPQHGGDTCRMQRQGKNTAQQM